MRPLTLLLSGISERFYDGIRSSVRKWLKRNIAENHLFNPDKFISDSATSRPTSMAEPASELVDLNRAALHEILPDRWPMNSYLSLEVSGPRPLRAAMVAFGGRGATNKT